MALVLVLVVVVVVTVVAVVAVAPPTLIPECFGAINVANTSTSLPSSFAMRCGCSSSSSPPPLRLKVEEEEEGEGACDKERVAACAVVCTAALLGSLLSFGRAALTEG